MGSRILNFIKYNNAFTLAFVFLMLSTGTIFAANEELRSAVISSEEVLVAVDNSLIRAVDLDTFDPAVQIVEVSEDDDNYYVTYRMNSIGVYDGVWSEVADQEVLTVTKRELGESDLGLYAAVQIQQVVDKQLLSLRQVQQIERQIGSVERIIQTEYSGLIGKMFDPEQTKFIGYKPVIPEEKRPVALPRSNDSNQPSTIADAVVAVQQPPQNQPVEPEADVIGEDTSESPSQPETPTSTPTVTDVTAPTITLNGLSNTVLSVGETYQEPGATALDDTDGDISNLITIESNVNTAQIGNYTVTYTVTDTAANTATEQRSVSITEPETQVPTEPVPEAPETAV